jgi:hypothetical protein
MKTNGNTIRSSTTPVRRTTILKRRPRSLWKVMSPNPRVVMTVRAQYTPVTQECSCPSKWYMIKRKPAAKIVTVATSRSE